jgi:hypothetical protein
MEKAAAWKSPKNGLSHSAWKSRKSGGISTFPTAPATTVNDWNPTWERRIADRQRKALVFGLRERQPSNRETSYSITG